MNNYPALRSKFDFDKGLLVIHRRYPQAFCPLCPFLGRGKSGAALGRSTIVLDFSIRAQEIRTRLTEIRTPLHIHSSGNAGYSLPPVTGRYRWQAPGSPLASRVLAGPW